MEKRTILWYMVFWGFAINYMFRVNINIAIVSMIVRSHKSTNKTIKSECTAEIVSSKANGTFARTFPQDDLDDDDKFEWDEYQVNAVLGAFYVLHTITQLPGGVLAQRYGTKIVFGMTNGLAALLAFAIPTSAKINYKILVVVRILQGFISGGSWPSMHTMTASWIPAHERSRFVSAYLGSSIGAAVTYVMCGYLIAAFGWESVFHISGALGLFWIICWTLFVYDTPAKHPTISVRERTYIEKHIGNTVRTSSKPLPIPWKSLLLSRPLLINLMTQCGGIYGLLTLATQGPSYFNHILGLDIQQTGLWTGMSHIFRWMFSFGFSMICDYLVKSNIMSLTNVRKFATVFANILQGIFVIGIALVECNTIVAVMMFICATAVNGAVSSGSLAAAVDLAPNYAGVIQGIVGTFGTCPGFLSPIVVGYLTINQQTLKQWGKVFYIVGSICISTGLLYMFFGTSKIQTWNTYQQPNEKEMKEMIKKPKTFKTSKI